MIVEERCYTLKPGTVALYYQDYDPRGLRIQRRILGNLIGYFHTRSASSIRWCICGATNRLRSVSGGVLAADTEWQNYLKQSPDIIVKMENRILVPAPFSPIK